mgnify:CR=1 FL=1
MPTRAFVMEQLFGWFAFLPQDDDDELVDDERREENIESRVPGEARHLQKQGVEQWRHERL